MPPHGKVTAEQVAQVERAVQRLELYDRGVVFQRKIDDALAECSVQLEAIQSVFLRPL